MAAPGRVPVPPTLRLVLSPEFCSPRSSFIKFQTLMLVKLRRCCLEPPPSPFCTTLHPCPGAQQAQAVFCAHLLAGPLGWWVGHLWPQRRGGVWAGP